MIEKMWVNIVNLHGTVSEVAPQANGLRLSFDEQSLGPCTVTIDERTLVSQGSTVAAFDGSLHLEPGQSLQIIGLALADGSIRATHLLL